MQRLSESRRKNDEPIASRRNLPKGESPVNIRSGLSKECLLHIRHISSQLNRGVCHRCTRWVLDVALDSAFRRQDQVRGYLDFFACMRISWTASMSWPYRAAVADRMLMTKKECAFDCPSCLLCFQFTIRNGTQQKGRKAHNGRYVAIPDNERRLRLRLKSPVSLSGIPVLQPRQPLCFRTRRLNGFPSLREALVDKSINAKDDHDRANSSNPKHIQSRNTYVRAASEIRAPKANQHDEGREQDKCIPKRSSPIWRS